MEQLEVRTGRDCFVEVVRDHSRYVVAVLRRQGVEAGDAEDVAQEVFLAVHAQLAGFAGRSCLRTWLCGICRNKARDYRRKRNRRRELFEARLQAPCAEASDPHDELMRNETAERVRKSLDRLPLAQREVFVLHELHDIPMREIAASLGCPLETAYSRYRIASGKLRASFAAQVMN